MVVALYNRALAAYPILTQSAATAVLFAAGDVLAQQGVEGKGLAGHEWARTGRLALFGLVVAGPALSHWYRFLDRRIVLRNAHPLTTLSARVAMDQFVFSPVSVATFFTVNTLLEDGKLDMGKLKTKLSATYSTALVNNWKVWIPVQYANFWFVPVQHRLLVVNTVALGWNTYMSNLNAKGSEIAEEEVALAVPVVEK
ncbi:hypothetical protein AMAG_11076 [Allomyces macrogynus ATCC 38327]|uniref:Mpv17/PMP22 family protein n=1 Tax=Allomyces macrogynus (strain ATCC 38327) TaxID=578462 RepID=A0A0L0SSU5_ALLM3|nr:hypothetical protein AMAG_11076 [Allomyces macrogynus ATCC 38327]|eukprot:KNE65450.1 hypothetical protein AMAG_11076 [Allomyces macrogynus ATCC 38327]